MLIPVNGALLHEAVDVLLYEVRKIGGRIPDAVVVLGGINDMIKMGKLEAAEEMEQVMIEEGCVCMRVLSAAYPISQKVLGGVHPAPQPSLDYID